MLTDKLASDIDYNDTPIWYQPNKERRCSQVEKTFALGGVLVICILCSVFWFAYNWRITH